MQIVNQKEQAYWLLKSLNKFILSDQGNKTFKEIVQKQWRSQERNDTDGDVSYIPHDFKSMLEFISWKISREQWTKVNILQLYNSF